MRDALTRREFIGGVAALIPACLAGCGSYVPISHVGEYESEIVAVTDEGFEREVLKCSLPVLVDAWAEWCSSCRDVHKFMVDWSVEYAGRMKVCEAKDTDAPHVVGLLTSDVFPAFGLFYGGNLEFRHVGGLDILKHRVDSYLAKF